MKSDERRKSIVNLLLFENRPVSGSELSEKYGVSRQIIVKDISILKEQGNDILATSAGYVIRSSPLNRPRMNCKPSLTSVESVLTFSYGIRHTAKWKQS